VDELTTPKVDPLQRTDVAEPASYRPGEEVWVYRHGEWRPGVVEAGGLHGVQVRYWVGRGTRVDTVRPEYVMRREPM
jgi:hypothetical protein